MRKIGLLLIMFLLLLGACSSPAPVAEEYWLPVVGSAAKLNSLLTTWGNIYRSPDAATGGEVKATSQGQYGGDHSLTNVQVQGIDEGDLVKTDGTYLYHIAGDRVFITRARPAASLAIIREIWEEGFSPETLYVDSTRLVVSGLQWRERKNERGLRPIRPCQTARTRVLVYDIRDKEDILLSRDILLDGFTIATRKKDNCLYLVNCRYTFRHMEDQELPLPSYQDSAAGSGERVIGYDEIHYFPGGEARDFVLVAALDLERGGLRVKTYLGVAHCIYMSHDYLYMALAEGAGANTAIHRFSIDGTKIAYTGKGTVPGYPLNQFSMDEYEGYFRIATTVWQGEATQNNLFILDRDLKPAGELKGLAKGESIYAARFMGERGYLVTFETMDPLFALDLSNPRVPRVLGELKIPGFSNYLQPLDSRHLLGIGLDTVLHQDGDREFVQTGGLKLALFDVSDVKNPLEKQALILGENGSRSEAMCNHKAVFLREDVLALPAVLAKKGGGLAFSGALFFKLDGVNGIRETGRVSHLVGPVSEDWPFWSGSEVRRIVQIGPAYYTLSDRKVMAHQKEDLAVVAEIDLPEPAQPEY